MVKKQEKMVIYQAKNGAIELRGDLSHETVWATQKQIADVFGVNVRTINEHLKNIFKTEELNEDSVIRKFRITAADGKTYDTQHYNLDAIISVGYRVNSKTATEFRKWATKTLREHITKGYTINRKRIASNYDEFMKSVEGIQSLLPEHVTFDPKDVLELIKEFAGTWVSLDAYDKETLEIKGTSKKSVRLTSEQLLEAIGTLRTELMQKGEATDIFAQERASGSIEGIVGNVMQSFGGKPMYGTVEEKAAHLVVLHGQESPIHRRQQTLGCFCIRVVFAQDARKGCTQYQPVCAHRTHPPYRRE
jgi:AraC-like DNA-binding protein